MTTIRVFEPALCCNTGVCGPDTDAALITFTADLGYAKEQGIDIERHNLANDPGAFVADPTALALLNAAGSDGLPLTVVDGVTVRTGTYPSRAELLLFAGGAPRTQLLTLTDTSASADAGEGSACCGGSGCC